MNILVTGGAGFIGSHTCEALLARGDKVVCLDNFNSAYARECKEKNIEECKKHENFTLVEGDLASKEQLTTCFSQHPFDKVIHLAARAGVRYSLERPDLYAEANIKGLINLLELCVMHKIKDITFASSSSVYGRNTKVPFSEDDSVVHPVSPYAATKRAGELLCYTYHYLYNLNIACLRFFTVYGPRGRQDMAPYLFTKSILEGKPITRFGDGSSRRDYTFITDIVSGVLAAMDKNKGFEIYNLGNDKPTDLNTFISLIEKHTGKKAVIDEKPMPQADVPQTWADLTKSRTRLGYDPQVSIDEGLGKFIAWFKKEKGFE
jgi:UDP-glucuronate 4-epimerase